MRIGSNISSLMVQHQLSITTKAIARSLNRLSTGQRLGLGDVADVAMITRLEAQQRGYLAANQNINQAKGMLATAESAMDAQVEILTRMRELALRGSNGTLTSADRANINLEVSQLYAEFQRITNSTEFNGSKLLDGSLGQRTLQTQSNAQNGLDLVKFEIGDLSAANVFRKTVGLGTFTSGMTTTVPGAHLSGLVTADFNNDGHIDSAVSSATGNSMTILLGNGDGTFYNHVDLETGGGPGQIQIGDFNGDGVKDLVTYDQDETTFSIFIGKGDGTFESRITLAGYSAAAVGDLNGDGRDDIVRSDGNDVNSAVVYYGKADGTFTASQSLTPHGGDGFSDVRLVDVNHDDKLDLVAWSSADGATWIFLNDGSGDFSETASYTYASGGGQIATFGDFNNDGNMDFVSGYLENQIYLGNGTGTSFTAGATLNTTTAMYLQAIDLNGDNALDLITDESEVYLNNGSGSFTRTQTNLFTSSSYPGFSAADLNGDGVADFMAIVDTSGTVGAYLANATTTSATGDINVSTQSKAQALLTILDTALAGMKAEQARLGALHERLDITASNNLLMSENLSEAKSKIQDIDIALETAELVRQQILQQAQVAIMAQANIQMRIVLDLLRFK